MLRDLMKLWAIAFSAGALLAVFTPLSIPAIVAVSVLVGAGPVVAKAWTS